ncbi:MAG: chromosomal replication initiator protein DnaA [Proteobacteria bacterium]|nr:chromosomal replication initiator protein DnaA [Pseudomonadota bacterium]
MKVTQEIWGSVKTVLKQELGDSTYESWLKPISFGDESDESKLILRVPTKFMRDWIVREYSSNIKNSVLEVIGTAPIIEYQVKPFEFKPDDDLNLSPEKTQENNSEQSISNEPDNIEQKNLTVAEESKQDELLEHSNILDPRYTFDNFIVGKSNEFAYAAARNIAESDDNKLYNPFFLHGGVGLGKTHLMHGMAHHIMQSGKGKRVLYMSSEKFLQQFTQSMRFNNMVEFKERFRSVDILMVDDFQFLAGKNATQEEFFHTFNALVDMNKRIILTADKSPHELSGIEDRLRSRLGCGLSTEVHIPGVETRLAILQSKAKSMKVELSNDVSMLLADRITSNVRELEGALNRLVAHSQLTQQEVTIDTVHKLLQDLFRNSSKIITLDEIQKKAAEYYNIRMSDMHSARRSRDIARPRQIAMFLSKKLTSKSLPEIGRSFGGRDHTTVIHAVKAVEKLKSADPTIEEDLKILENLLSK